MASTWVFDGDAGDTDPVELFGVAPPSDALQLQIEYLHSYCCNRLCDSLFDPIFSDQGLRTK